MRVAGSGLALVAAVFAGLGSSVVLAADMDTNLYTLDLSGKGTLADVFASGLRPRRWDSSGNDECFVEDKYLAFKLPRGGAVAIFAAQCDFKVFADGRLKSVEARSPNMTTDSASQWMKPIVNVLNGSPEALEAYLKLVSTGDQQTEQKLRIEGSGSDFTLATPWPGAESDLPALGVSLRWRWDKQLPIVMHTSVTWARPYASMRFPSKPVKAPPGFEQFPIRTEPYVAEAIRKTAQSGVEPLPISTQPRSANPKARSESGKSNTAPNDGAAPGVLGLQAQSGGAGKTWALILAGMGCCLLLWLAIRWKSAK